MPAIADHVDLNALADGVIASPARTSDVTFLAPEGLFVVHNFFIPNDTVIGWYNVAQSNGANDVTIRFNEPVRNVSLETFALQDGDSITIAVWARRQIQGSVEVAPGSDTHIDLSSFSRIRPLIIDDHESTGGGIGYGLINFERIAPLPEKQERHNDRKAARKAARTAAQS